MAKKAYVGVNNIAHNVKNIYVGVNGVAHKVVKGYVGVNGVARLFWDGGGSVPVGSWDYWTTVSGITNIFMKYGGNQYYIYKTNNKIAYYASIKMHYSYNQRTYYSPLLVSTDANAVAFNMYFPAQGTRSYGSQGSFVDSNNITWYYATLNVGDSFDRIDVTPYDCNMYDTIYDYTASGRLQAAQDLVNRIYAVPFHENYQIGQEYRIPACGDVKRTIRKIFGWSLFRNAGDYDTKTAYRTFSDNVNTIIDTIMQNIHDHNNDNGVVWIQTDGFNSSLDYCQCLVMHGHYADYTRTYPGDPKADYFDRSTFLPKEQGDSNNFKRFEYVWGWGGDEPEEYTTSGFENYPVFEWYIGAETTSSGTTNFWDDDTYYGGQVGNVACVGINDIYDGSGSLSITNLGIDL